LWERAPLDEDCAKMASNSLSSVATSNFGPAADPAGPPRAESKESAANGKFLFEMIVADLQWTALQAASFCIIATACAAPDCRFSLRACRHFAYDDTRVMRLALRYADEVGLPSEARTLLDRLYGDLSDLQKLMGPLIDAVTLSPSQRERLQRALPTLRNVAHAAAGALSLLEPAVRARLHPNYVDDGAAIRQYLARAARGALTDIDRLGVLTTPRLKQRRQSPRLQVNKPCRLALATAEFEAVLVDVSRKGLGLVCKAELAEKQRVVVLIAGRRLDAVVARKQGQQIGLTLTKPLAFTDPLFQAG
jgi:hypothetical protein